MKITKAKELISYLELSSNIKIGILDNNTINFLVKADKISFTNKILSGYNLLLIPNWVYEEVSDSRERVDYLELLSNNDINVFLINEFDYEEISKWKQQYVYKFFLYSCFKVAKLKCYLKRYVERNMPLSDLEDYKIWIEQFYNNAFDGDKLNNGRQQRKNAGEISICVLAFIISYIYSLNKHSITILSNDRDTYDFISYAKNKLMNDEFLKNKNSLAITFKSNDFIIREIHLSDYIKCNNCLQDLLKLRDEKRSKYIKYASDESIEEHEHVISNCEFEKLLKDKTFNIIF